MEEPLFYGLNQADLTRLGYSLGMMGVGLASLFFYRFYFVWFVGKCGALFVLFRRGVSAAEPMTTLPARLVSQARPAFPLAIGFIVIVECLNFAVISVVAPTVGENSYARIQVNVAKNLETPDNHEKPRKSATATFSDGQPLELIWGMGKSELLILAEVLVLSIVFILPLWLIVSPCLKAFIKAVRVCRRPNNQALITPLPPRVRIFCLAYFLAASWIFLIFSMITDILQSFILKYGNNNTVNPAIGSDSSQIDFLNIGLAVILFVAFINVLGRRMYRIAQQFRFRRIEIFGTIIFAVFVRTGLEYVYL